MSKKTLLNLAYAFLAIVLLGGFVAVFWLSQSVDFSRSEAIVNHLRTFKQIDTEWDLHASRVASNLVQTDVQLENGLPEVTQLTNSLQNEVKSYWADDPATSLSLTTGVAQLQTLMEMRSELMDEMESESAIARDSLVQLQPLLEQIGTSVEATDTSDALKKGIEALGQKLYAETLMYTYDSNPQARTAILQNIQALRDMTAPLPPDVRDGVALYAANIPNVLEQRDGRAEVVRQQLESFDIGTLVDNLTSKHEQANLKLLDRMQDYQRMLTVYSAILLVLLAVIGWRFLRNFQALNHSNARLQQAHTELQESHLQLVQSEKMASLGQMVAGVAHEINTPLAYVKGTFDIMESNLQPVNALVQRCMEFSRLVRTPERNKVDVSQKFLEIENKAKFLTDQNILPELDQLIGNGVHGIEKISEIVLNLKNFSRLDREKSESFLIEACIDSTLLLARSVTRDKVQIDKQYTQTPPIVGAPSQINQVLLNIITNAVHAIESQKVDPGILILRTSVDARKKMVVVEIKDNGTGIAEENLKKIFDPFFTSKPVGQGTGLGLSISYKIIQEHGGEITVQSKKGQGTSFFIWLPFKDEQVQPKGDDAPQASADDVPLFLD